MSVRPEIESLLRQVARRRDGFMVRKVALTALLAASATGIAAALFWVLRGHPVPAAVFAIIAITTGVAAVAYGFWKRMQVPAAVREADRFFELKDGIASARHLAAHAPDANATALQWQWLAPRLADCDVQRISENFPKRTAVLAAVLAAAAITLGLLPPSAAVRAAEQLALETRQRVEESKQELEQLIEELEKDITAPEEKEGLKLDEFRKLVKSIDETGNRAEAARQFARIEQKIRDATRALDQQRDEETLKLAASELAKAEETEARQLGKKLDAKELKEAAEMLEKLAAKKFDPKEFKADKAKALSEAKQDLAKMRAASKRLAAAGKQRQGARQAAGGQGANSQGGDGQMGEGTGEQGKALEDLMAELDDAAAEAEKDLEEIEFDPDAEPGDGEAMGRANGALGKLGKHMRGMHGKRMAKSKLDQLRQALGQAQAFTQGQSQMLGQGPGGREAGTGSSWSERKERDDSQKNGSLAQLQGQHGSGPSLSAVEESETGTGVSGRRGEAKQREFARQTESFVQRDDVPEALKLGVRNYFENLQSARKPEE
jgi:hypothetical protein